MAGILGLFKARPAKTAGAALYTAAARQARTPAFYASLGVPDTPEGRFELYALHLALLLNRLRGQGEAAAETAQAAFDTFLQGLDDALREIGVGDLTVPKRMKKLGAAMYGRARSLGEAVAALPDAAPLQDLLGRTVLPPDAPGLAPMAAYVAKAAQQLAAAPLSEFIAGRAAWPEVEA